MQPDDDRTQAVTVLSKGTVIGHYRIVEKIGAGGMGEVYLAEDTELNRKVALKFLSSHLCQDADCRTRFKREAQAAAKLNHPNIVTIYEVSEFNGRPFFAMEHVEGQPLSELIKQGDCSLDKAIDLSLQICEGLQEAHKAGITHRDIKPANILISQSGRAKLVDFGLASVAGADKLTKEGSTLGTIGYMSPEQVQGKPTDHRSDLFSFGVVLYELVSCKSPFKGETPAATMNAIAQQIPEPLARYKAGVPDELQRIVSKLLQKDPALRYQTAADVISDLSGLKATSQLSIIKPASQRKMLAVLPFENLGSPDDEYFADGITDEITGKLATVRELGVISRTSTMQYKKTTKNLRQIATELGVDYILEGTIRWDKSGATSRVRILPQLIRASDDTHLWAETYQRPLEDIFALQADIATRIVEAMNITLLKPENTALQAIPTQNLEAYQAYLRGNDYMHRDYKRESHKWAVQMFQRAVELDPTFAQAYVNLAGAHASLYFYGYDATPARLSQVKAAIDRALSLQPDLPDAHLGLGYSYYYWGLRDYDRALEQLAIAEVGLPNNPRILRSRAYVWRRQGKFKAAVEQLERAFVLDPRDWKNSYEIGLTYGFLRNYAAQEKYLNESISLAPDQYGACVEKVRNYYLWLGDTGLARATLASIPKQDDDEIRLQWFLLHLYERDYASALDRLAAISPMAKIDQSSFIPKVQLEGLIYSLMNDPDRVHACYDSSRVILEKAVKELPDDSRVHSSLGLAYAGLGRKDNAIREGKLGVELLPVSKDAVQGPVGVRDLALIYVLVGEYDAALDQIEYLLSISCDFSVPLLRLDPRYDPLRNLPRYQKLLEKYGT